MGEAHRSRESPHLARDPIPAACEMVLALQTLVTRGFDIHDPVVITVGSLHSGSRANVIPDEVRFEATVRSYSAAARARVKDGIVRTVRGIGAAHGLETDDYEDGCPVTVNDHAEAEFAARTVAELHGGKRFSWADAPLPASEDFSRVLDKYLAPLSRSAPAHPERTPTGHRTGAPQGPAIRTTRLPGTGGFRRCFPQAPPSWLRARQADGLAGCVGTAQSVTRPTGLSCTCPTLLRPPRAASGYFRRLQPVVPSPWACDRLARRARRCAAGPCPNQRRQALVSTACSA